MTSHLLTSPATPVLTDTATSERSTTVSANLNSLIDQLRLMDRRIVEAGETVDRLRRLRDEVASTNLGRTVYQRPEVIRNATTALGHLIDAARAQRDVLWTERDTITEKMQALIDLQAQRFPTTGREQAGLDPMTGVAKQPSTPGDWYAAQPPGTDTGD